MVNETVVSRCGSYRVAVVKNVLGMVEILYAVGRRLSVIALAVVRRCEGGCTVVGKANHGRGSGRSHCRRGRISVPGGFTVLLLLPLPSWRTPWWTRHFCFRGVPEPRALFSRDASSPGECLSRLSHSLERL